MVPLLQVFLLLLSKALSYRIFIVIMPYIEDMDILVNKYKIQCLLYINIYGGLGVKSSSRDPRFAGENPTEVDGFFRT